jgi:hypothetical protein
MDFSVVLAASAAVNRFIEAVKPFVRKLNVSVEVQDSVLVVIQVAAGIALALMGQLNLLIGVPTIPPLVAVILTGAVLGLGADIVNVVVDFLYGWKANVTGTSSSKSTLTVVETEQKTDLAPAA